MNAVLQEEKTHGKKGEAVKTSIGQNKPSCRREEPAHPRLDSAGKLPDKEQPLLNREFSVRDPEAEVDEGEGAKFTVKHVNDPMLFHRRLTHYYDLNFVVIDL